MNFNEIKTTQSTINQVQLEEFLQAGWTLIGTEEFTEGDEPPLKKTRYVVGHANPDQKLPEALLKIYKSLADAKLRKKQFLLKRSTSHR